MRSLASDLRYAARELRRRPGFTLTAVLSLALGIGATSAVFSVIYAILIDPRPYTGSDRMMELSMLDKAGRLRFAGLNFPQIDHFRQAKAIESVVGQDGWNLTTTDGDLPEDVVAAYVTPNAPSHWGTPALKGRWMIPSDALPGKDPEPIVVLGYRFWQRYFSGDPEVVGRTIQLVHKTYQIVGVRKGSIAAKRASRSLMAGKRDLCKADSHRRFWPGVRSYRVSPSRHFHIPPENGAIAEAERADSGRLR